MHKEIHFQVSDQEPISHESRTLLKLSTSDHTVKAHTQSDQENPDKAPNARPKIIDLFAGVGGLSLGAARAGFDIALAVEKDKHAYAAHKLNFPNSKHSDHDISTISGVELLRLAGLKIGELDGLIGGPPCQGFSSMGHRNIEDARNNLFSKFFQLVNETQPKFFVAENVLGILDQQYNEIRNQALAQISCEYTILEPMSFKASDYGAPTIRTRIFFIGYQKKYINNIAPSDFSAKKVKVNVSVGEALTGLPPIRSHWIDEKQGMRKVAPPGDNDYFKKISGCIPPGVGNKTAIDSYHEQRIVTGCLGTKHSLQVESRYGKLKAGQTDSISKSVRLDKNGLCPTLRAGTGPERGSYQAVRPIHPSSPRVITPREAARLQGFPDWFQFAPSKWHSFRQIGNSVSPFVAEAALNVIFNKLSPANG